MKSKLNLGCGTDIKNPNVWWNHDIKKHRKEIDAVHDLNILPWPWKDDQFTEIYAYSVLEHLKLNLVESMDECWRILVKTGIMRIKYPLVTNPRIFDDPTHYWSWNLKTLEFLDPEYGYGAEYNYYTRRNWKILEKHTSHKGHSCWATLTPRK